jgi:hypothetical protein
MVIIVPLQFTVSISHLQDSFVCTTDDALPAHACQNPLDFVDLVARLPMLCNN